MAATKQLDQTKAAAFETRLVEALNAGALSVMISVGHRTGLFDAMADLAAASSEDIARRANQQERYVRRLWPWSRSQLDGRLVSKEPICRL